MSQGRQKLSDFYTQIQKQLSLMINTIEPEKYAHKETIEALIEAHRRRALDVFIRGLNGDLPALLLVQNVKSLPEAYSACLKLQNADRRNTFHRPSLTNIIDTPSFLRNRQDYNGQGYSDQQHPRQPNNKRTWQDGNRKVPRPSYSGSGQTRPQNWRSTPSALVKSNYEPSSQSRNTRFTPYDGANRGAGSTGHMNQTASKQQKLFHLIPVDKEVISDTASKEQLTEDQVNFTIGASCLAYHI